MVLGEIRLLSLKINITQPVFDHLPNKNFFFYPYRHCRQEANNASRSKGMIRLKKTFKLYVWLLVVGYSRKLADIKPTFCQNIVNCVYGKRKIVFFPRETFLLRSGYNLTIDQQSCGTVMVKSRNTEN